MTRKVAVLLAVFFAVLFAGCSSDDGSTTPDGTSISPDGSPQADSADHDAPPSPDQGTAPGPDVTPAADGPTTTGGGVGAVCTQEDRDCAAGLRCVFLEAWNAPKGTCVRELADGCQSWDDPRCDTPGTNYGVMCSVYTENSVTAHVCLLLCELNGQSYDCPPAHTCKQLRGYQLCVPQ